MTTTYYDQIEESAAYLRSKIDSQPKIGIVLGSGLSKLSQKIEISRQIAYEDIPHFPLATVQGHGKSLIFGKLGNKDIVALSGRFHFYEGYGMKEVSFPIRVMKALGVETMIISNAAGGLKPGMNLGDMMFITDHINLQGANPLIGANDERLGPRFPDMFNAYDKKLVQNAIEIAEKNGYSYTTGVYCGVTGPTFETPAEYKYLHVIGGDAVGMSTVPEVIVARHGGMKVFAVSVISDIGYPPGEMESISHDFVLEKARAAEPLLSQLVIEMIEKL